MSTDISMPDSSRSHFYAVIMAGGSGTRLWPLSRKTSPKQFHSFISSKSSTLFEDTWTRLRGVIPDATHIFVCTADLYRDTIRSLVPEIPPECIITEPEARGTAAAIALSSRHIMKRDKDAIIATIPSDHMIANDTAFGEALLASFETASRFPASLVTIGINPTAPDTGFGYIKMGEELETMRDHRIFTIDTFKEKPDRATAEEYLKSWEYLWNAGYFIFSGKTFASFVETHAPNLHEALEDMEHAPDESSRADIYRRIPNDPIEPAIVEKLSPRERVVIPAPLDWSDIGNWSAIFDTLEKHHETSVIGRGEHVDVGSKKCLVLSSAKLIATIGLTDIVVVETDDSILVANKSHVSDIKHLLEKIRSEKGDRYL